MNRRAISRTRPSRAAGAEPATPSGHARRAQPARRASSRSSPRRWAAILSSSFSARPRRGCGPSCPTSVSRTSRWRTSRAPSVNAARAARRSSGVEQKRSSARPTVGRFRVTSSWRYAYSLSYLRASSGARHRTRACVSKALSCIRRARRGRARSAAGSTRAPIDRSRAARRSSIDRTAADRSRSGAAPPASREAISSFDTTSPRSCSNGSPTLPARPAAIARSSRRSRRLSSSARCSQLPW